MCLAKDSRVVQEEREEWRGVKESGLNCVCVCVCVSGGVWVCVCGVWLKRAFLNKTVGVRSACTEHAAGA